MKNSKKILSIALTLAMLMSAIFCTGAVANAENTTATYPTSAKAISLSLSTTEAAMDWSSLGQNIITDSTVAEFNSDNTYKNYYKVDSSTSKLVKEVVNPNAWWGRACNDYQVFNNDSNSYKGPGTMQWVSTTETHTQDGTGSLCFSKFYDRKRLPMTMSGDSYYVVTFWAKATAAISLQVLVYDNDARELVSSSTNAEITTSWKRFTYLIYCNENTGRFLEFAAWPDPRPDVYVDEIELYKVGLDYAQSCIDLGNKLVSGTTTAADSTHKALYTQSNWETRNYYEIDFDAFGENLIPDPTVNEFVDDGNGGKVYDSYYINDQKANGTDNTNAWWGKHVNSAATQVKGDMWSSPKTHGAVVYDPANSHTDDGSGVIKLDSANFDVNLTLPMPVMEKYSYYLITYWVKGNKSYETRLGYNLLSNGSYSEYSHKNLDSYYASSWRRVTAIVYTGNHKSNYPYVGTYYSKGTNTLYMDDFGVYKLDAAYATQCMTAGKLLAPASFDANASATNKTVKVPNFTDFDENRLGANLVTDPTVAKFTGDEYNSYSWWNKAPFTHDADMYHSMVSRGFVTKDTSFSHTADGSGAIIIPKQTNAVLYIPVAQAGTYYLISFWAQSSGIVQSAPFSYGDELHLKLGDTINGWQKISWILYAGKDAAIPACSMFIYGSNSEVIIDDVSVQIMDYDYGKECIATGAPAAATTINNTKEVATAGTTDIAVTDGYFVPYGAATMDSGATMLEKLGNGRFYATKAGTVNVVQFKYPTGTVGTFGASIKDGDDTAESYADKSGIQFGSLITDYLNVEDSGTLVIRGDFAAFRATLPTYSRERILKIFYNRLTENVEAGVPVRISNAGKSVDVMYVPRTTYMWKNSANTELQYAVRVFGIKTEYADTAYTAVGYVTKDSAVTFSSEIKTATFSGLN